MGAHNAHAEFDGTLSPEQLRKAYTAYIQKLSIEYGTDPYNGTLSTTNGLIISDKVFDTTQEAMDYGLDNTSKWEEAMAVKARGVETVRSRFTFDGKTNWDNTPFDKAWENGRTTIKVADQLTKTEGKRLTKLYTDHAAAKTATDASYQVVDRLLREVLNARAPLPSDHFAKLKRESAAYRKLRDKSEKLTAALDAEVKKLTEKYVKEETKQGKPVWVISGWAAC